jgi:hypothetical protein
MTMHNLIARVHKIRALSKSKPTLKRLKRKYYKNNDRTVYQPIKSEIR